MQHFSQSPFRDSFPNALKLFNFDHVSKFSDNFLLFAFNIFLCEALFFYSRLKRDFRECISTAMFMCGFH